MPKELVITATGPDRPGLVDALSKALFEAGANLADSRMVNLRGRFAFMALVEIDAAAAETIAAKASAVGEAIGLKVSIAAEGDDEAAPTQGLPCRLRAYALDQPGIAHRIAHLLGGHRINIEELQTRLQPGPYEGRPQFSIELRMTVPADVSMKQLREELTALCDTLNCDFELHGG